MVLQCRLLSKTCFSKIVSKNILVGNSNLCSFLTEWPVTPSWAEEILLRLLTWKTASLVYLWWRYFRQNEWHSWMWLFHSKSLFQRSRLSRGWNFWLPWKNVIRFWKKLSTHMNFRTSWAQIKRLFIPFLKHKIPLHNSFWN